MEKKIGFIGLGLMGGNMVHRLVDHGFDVLAYVRRPEVAEEFKGKVTFAKSIAEVAANRSLICSSLSNPPAVKAVYLGDDGVMKNAKPGTVCIDFSSVDPETTKLCYEAGKAAKVGFVDSPVSGGPTNCFDGSLVLIIGGDDADVAKGDQVLKALTDNGGTIHRAGPSGAGVTVKLVNNAIAISNMVTTTEGFILGVKAGVDPDLLYSILNTSGARSYHLNKRIPFVLAGSFEPRFKLETARKDVGLAIDMAHKIGMPLSVITNTYELLNLGMAEGWGEEDCVAIIKFYESLAHVEARSKKK